MARRQRESLKQHGFRNRLVLNQWAISLFGVDPLREHRLNGRAVRPFNALAAPIKDPRMEGLDETNTHYFFHNLVGNVLFPQGVLEKEQVRVYEENIAHHTRRINEKRTRPMVWKYFQWLALLFTEIYLDKYFNDRDGLLGGLNEFVARFNDRWDAYANVPPFVEDDLNKLCFQSATGSGKTLMMHVNLLQYRHYAQRAGRLDELSRVILLTPNDRLSEQHAGELHASGLSAELYATARGTLFAQTQRDLNRVDVIEITKLADQEGPQTVATRSLGDQNLLLVDEGHRGMSGKEEGAWVRRRNMLCSKGFTFEYSATFEQSVMSSKNEDVISSYAKCILFDYSYRYFYEDGFGKDYQILNLPDPGRQQVDRAQGNRRSQLDHQQAVATELMPRYLTGCLLKFYQQLRLYEEMRGDLVPFNMEKPLWVFVGSSVTGGKWKKDEEIVASDVAKVLQYVADFLARPDDAQRTIQHILTATGQDTGLLDENDQDIFDGSFVYLASKLNAGETAQSIYQDILRRLFNSPGGGALTLCRIKGESGEVALRAGASEEPFGLINVGDAKGLCDHCEAACRGLSVSDSEFSEAMFSTVKESSSPINLLVGSKKFVEGWDCWRVSTMGLMHVGKSEGAQIIQLFGRGVRLKGYGWSLKRSGHTEAAAYRPRFIEELETLNVFGVEADFMERFREFLKEEGLPGNERKHTVTIPLNITYDFGKRLQVLRPKQKAADGREYDFKRDAAVPTVGDIPDYIRHNTVVSDWYPRIQAMRSRGTGEAAERSRGVLESTHLAMIDFDALYFELEQFKRDRSWWNLNITKDGIRALLADPSWYTLYIPPSRLTANGWENVRLWQQVATELLKRYCDHFYNYRKSEFIEPRLEQRELTPTDDNLPQESQYTLIVDGSEEQVIEDIERIKQELEENREQFITVRDLHACRFDRHLYQPLFHVGRSGKVKIAPVALNESEYQFVQDLHAYCQGEDDAWAAAGKELFLLRNMSRGRGIGFFEAGNFYPDFIMWLLADGKQYVTFIEPHGLQMEGPGSKKVGFYQKIKEIEQRLGDPNVVLNSFILSWTRHAQLDWGLQRQELEQQHVLFMTEDKPDYVGKLLGMLGASQQ